MADKVITSEVFVAYSQCPHKAYLLLFSNDQGTPHDYTSILEERRKAHQTQYLETFKQSHENAKPYDEKNLRKGEFFIEAKLKVDCWEAACDVLTKVDQGASSWKVIYEPTIVVGTYSITKEQKTELLFFGKVLGHIQKNLPAAGKIVGMDGKTHRAKLEGGYKSIAPFLKTLQAWMEETPTEPPALILNKHCPSCQFREVCRAKAKEIDHLSLLTGVTEREIKKLNSKGIFTVTQLSYTYRARKQGKISKSRKTKYHHSLKALSIRDNRIYVVEKANIDLSNTLIFLDIEGIPDQNFYYLIGLVIRQGETMKEFSLWADNQGDEEKIWNQLIEIVSSYENCTIFHYGSYETLFFKSRSKKYCKDKDPVLEKIQSKLVNVLSLIYASIYFPTYSNSLKEIGKYLGTTWSENDSSGIQSLIWRDNWEQTGNNLFKKKLITYNKEDCLALKKVVESIAGVFNYNQELGKPCEFTSVSELISSAKEGISFKRNKFILEEFEFINRCSYFDYQREKVYFRGRNKDSRNEKKGGNARKVIKLRVNKEVFIPRPEQCPQCGSTKLYNNKRSQKIVLDVRFLEFGVKRWIVKYSTYRGRCITCGKTFNSAEYSKVNSKYGDNLCRFITYKIVGLRQSYNKILDDLRDIFGYHFDTAICSEIKDQMAKYYKTTYDNILKKIVNGTLLHADETSVSIKGVKAYVWVLTSIEEVIYFYSPTREGDYLKSVINGFNGVLVSDFYGAYDSIECPKQKCLIHLIRDMNDDLRRYPFDDEYKAFIKDFSVLLQSIVKTIDAYGLKKLHLGKHKKEVKDFFKKYLSKDFKSEISLGYIKKIKKFKDSLFTFLDYDDVPWNNNNAEHAIKTFAMFRKLSDGTFTENGIRQLLILISIYETCKYKDVNFLKFLLSGRTDIDDFKRDHRPCRC